MSNDILTLAGHVRTAAPPLTRRAAIGALGAFGAAAVLAACGSDNNSATTTSAAPAAPAASTTATTTAVPTAATTAATTAAPAGTTATSTPASGVDTAAYVVIPQETAGPYPGDGSNGKNILDQVGVVRGDIRSSIGTATGVADGVALTIKLTVLDSTKSFAPLAGAAVYVWHCDKSGKYSMYSQGATNENYLRGVQATDANGNVSFTSIFPAAYPGRWPHIHFEVYSSVADATRSATALATSQIALPEQTCNLVYATPGYTQSKTNMTKTTLASDNVFGDDGAVHELATITGSVDSGIVAQLTVPV